LPITSDIIEALNAIARRSRTSAYRRLPTNDHLRETRDDYAVMKRWTPGREVRADVGQLQGRSDPVQVVKTFLPSCGTCTMKDYNGRQHYLGTSARQGRSTCPRWSICWNPTGTI